MTKEKPNLDKLYFLKGECTTDIELLQAKLQQINNDIYSLRLQKTEVPKKEDVVENEPS